MRRVPGLCFGSYPGRLPGALASLVKPHWYPPFKCVLWAAGFLMLGVSTFTARLYSTLVHLLLGPSSWASARQTVSGATPGFFCSPPLFLTADGLYANISALSMLELPAVLGAWLPVQLHTARRVVACSTAPGPGSWLCWPLIKI